MKFELLVDDLMTTLASESDIVVAIRPLQCHVQVRLELSRFESQRSSGGKFSTGGGKHLTPFSG
jgi:hypothetical protein